MYLWIIIFFFKQGVADLGEFLLEKDMDISYSVLNTENFILVLFVPM